MEDPNTAAKELMKDFDGGGESEETLDTFSEVVMVTGVSVGSLLLCASLFVHIYICAKRPRSEIQDFLNVILFLMHITNGLSIALYVAVFDGKLIFDQMACSTWIRTHQASYLVVNLWLVLFLGLNWTFVVQYLKVAKIVPIAFTEKPVSASQSTAILNSLNRLKWVNRFFYVLTLAAFVATQFFRMGPAIGLYDIPWVFLTSQMIHAMCKIRSVLSQRPEDDFLINESMMSCFLALYVVYALVFLLNSATQIIIGYEIDDDNSTSWERLHGISNGFMLAQVVVNAAIQCLMLVLFLRFSQPYDPIWGRQQKQKDRTMLVFNPNKDRLLGYRDHRADSMRSLQLVALENQDQQLPAASSSDDGHRKSISDKSWALTGRRKNNAFANNQKEEGTVDSLFEHHDQLNDEINSAILQSLLRPKSDPNMIGFGKQEEVRRNTIFIDYQEHLLDGEGETSQKHRSTQVFEGRASESKLLIDEEQKFDSQN